MSSSIYEKTVISQILRMVERILSKNLWCSFFSKFRLLWVWFGDTHLLLILSTPRTTITFLRVSHYVYWGTSSGFFLLGSTSCHCLHAQAAQLSGLDPQEWLAFHLQLVSYWLLLALGNCPSLSFLWLSLQVVLDHGKTTCFYHLWGRLKCPWLIIKGLLLLVGNNLIGIYLT